MGERNGVEPLDGRPGEHPLDVRSAETPGEQRRDDRPGSHADHTVGGAAGPTKQVATPERERGPEDGCEDERGGRGRTERPDERPRGRRVGEEGR